MFVQLLSLIFAIFGLGFLVFIHELGHYIMARKEGMKVEAFSIGFGPPIFSWMRKDVLWQVCWLPFGGYVKIAGMQKEGSREAYEISEGFFSKKPMQRIRVSLMGPLVNIAFAMLIFVILWMSGGTRKSFSDFTHHVGWVNSKSMLYERGIRPGDRVDSYNGKPFSGKKDLVIASVMKDASARISGVKVDESSNAERVFDYTLSKNDLSSGFLFIPASYCFFNAAVEGAPILSSGIQKNDRILWADGETIYSLPQLQNLINSSSAFLTVQRGSEILQVKIPRVRLGDLRLTPVQKAEFDDWQHEAELKGKLSEVTFIPYLLSPKGDVEVKLSFFDGDDAKFPQLEEGDRILALDGRRVANSYDLLQMLQSRRVLMIVQRDPALLTPISWKDADLEFERTLDRADLHDLVSQIGVSDAPTHAGNLVLLSAVEPRPSSDFSSPSSEKEMMKIRKKLETIQDPQKRQESLRILEKERGRLVLGMDVRDREVRYNPGPLQQFSDMVKEMGFMLKNLFTGHLHAKDVSGPVGIIQVFQAGMSQGGVKEALFWMAMISLNLGFVNLLPIPVLDGGHIMFSLYEAVTKRRLSSKVMERMMIPFVGLLIFLLIYITYQDIIRLISRFF